ncbi:twin-arginine translocation protein TatC [Jejuia pallidilutea]|uniref:Twin-arginine translocation protein TatC n=1 Tax=Jejuia pallidilutea TaxID=504487 RepID=A0A090VWD0_9FLAO|nr:twin-arginine translocation protein TatC [Jejuia pallidilutea]GAL71391.1 twin-arginine translocation protein TatC [Jejuia pallidilutea]
MAKKDVNEMSFLDHLEELRWHLIRIVVAIVIVGTIAFLSSRFIFDEIIFAPLEMSFPTYDFLCKTANFINVETTFCGEKIPLILQNRTMQDNFLPIFGQQFLGDLS